MSSCSGLATGINGVDGDEQKIYKSKRRKVNEAIVS